MTCHDLSRCGQSDSDRYNRRSLGTRMKWHMNSLIMLGMMLRLTLIHGCILITQLNYGENLWQSTSVCDCITHHPLHGMHIKVLVSCWPYLIRDTLTPGIVTEMIKGFLGPPLTLWEAGLSSIYPGAMVPCCPIKVKIIVTCSSFGSWQVFINWICGLGLWCVIS